MQAARQFRRRNLIAIKQSNIKIKKEYLSTLAELLCLSLPLGTLRSFVDNRHKRVTLDSSTKRAWKIWRRMRQNQAYFANEHQRKSLEILSKGNIKKLMTYLDHAPSTRSKVRMNDYVESCNRVLRYLEKARYKRSRLRTIVRHIRLKFANGLNGKKIQSAMVT